MSHYSTSFPDFVFFILKLLLHEHVDQLQYIEEELPRQIWPCKRIISTGTVSRSEKTLRNRQRRRTEIHVLQGFGRCVLARKRVVSIANERYRRVWDSESGSFYYAQVLSGETSWSKSSIYLSLEPPVYVDETENADNKKSPKGSNFSYVHQLSNVSSSRDAMERDISSNRMNSISSMKMERFSERARLSPRLNRIISSSSSSHLSK